MAIIRQEDVVNGGEIVVISGVVERIIIKEAERTAKNLEYGITHIASLCVDNQWINFISLGIKEGRTPDISVNAGTKAQPKWVQIQEADEVKVVVTEKLVGGKAYYNAKKSGIKLVKKNATPGQQSQQGSGSNTGSYQAKPRNDSGIKLGHSVNGAMNFLITWGVEASNENIISYGKKVHGATEKLSKEHKEANPDMSGYDASASVGNAILNACKLVGTEADFEQGVYEIAKDFLENVVKPLGEFISTTKESVQPVKVTRSSPAKKTVTKAKPVEQKAPEPTSADFDDMGDDIPF